MAYKGAGSLDRLSFSCSRTAHSDEWCQTDDGPWKGEPPLEEELTPEMRVTSKRIRGPRFGAPIGLGIHRRRSPEARVGKREKSCDSWDDRKNACVHVG